MQMHKIILFHILRANTLNKKRPSVVQTESRKVQGQYNVNRPIFKTPTWLFDIPHLTYRKFIADKMYLCISKGKGHPITCLCKRKREADVYLQPVCNLGARTVGDQHASAALPTGKAQGPLYRRLVEIGTGRPHRDLITGVCSPQQVSILIELLCISKSIYIYICIHIVVNLMFIGSCIILIVE